MCHGCAIIFMFSTSPCHIPATIPVLPSTAQGSGCCFPDACLSSQYHVIHPVPNQQKVEVELERLLKSCVFPEVHPLAERQDHLFCKLGS